MGLLHTTGTRPTLAHTIEFFARAGLSLLYKFMRNQLVKHLGMIKTDFVPIIQKCLVFQLQH